MASPEVRVNFPAEPVPRDGSFVYEVITEWRKAEGNYQIGVPDPSLENFVRLRQGESQESFLRGGEPWIRKTFIFELRPVAVGSVSIPAFKIPCSLMPGSGQAEFLEVPQALIRVEEHPVNPTIVVLAAAVGIFAIAVPAVFLFFKRRHGPSPSEASSSPKFTRESFQDIERVFQHDPAGALLRLSSQLREFVGIRYKVSGSSLTDREMLSTLAAADLSGEEQASLKGFFARLEEAKFAGPGFARADFENLCRDVYKFIELRQTSLASTPSP